MKEAKKNEIVAVRNGKVRHFNLKSWNLMPEGKYGWSEQRSNAELPTAVKQNMGRPKAEPKAEVKIAAKMAEPDVNKD